MAKKKSVTKKPIIDLEAEKQKKKEEKLAKQEQEKIKQEQREIKKKQREKEELKNKIIAIFRAAIIDRTNGINNPRTTLAMEQCGIEPILGYRLTDNFIAAINTYLEKNAAPSIEIRQKFFEQVCNIFMRAQDKKTEE